MKKYSTPAANPNCVYETRKGGGGYVSKCRTKEVVNGASDTPSSPTVAEKPARPPSENEKTRINKERGETRKGWKWQNISYNSGGGSNAGKVG